MDHCDVGCLVAHVPGTTGTQRSVGRAQDTDELTGCECNSSLGVVACRWRETPCLELETVVETEFGVIELEGGLAVGRCQLGFGYRVKGLEAVGLCQDRAGDFVRSRGDLRVGHSNNRPAVLDVHSPHLGDCQLVGVARRRDGASTLSNHISKGSTTDLTVRIDFSNVGGVTRTIGAHSPDRDIGWL